jgi:hypothetical protein
LIKFIDRQYLANVFNNKSVAIIGSAPTVLQNEGTFIDSHDIVVRANNYKVKGLEINVGYRTDVHYSFYGSSIKKTVDELKADGVKLCMCKCPNDKPINSPWHEANGQKYGVDFRYIYKHREDFWFCDTYIPSTQEFLEQFNLLGKHIPTTGFAAILTIITLPIKELYITGFDFFSSGIHNVNEKWRHKNTGDPICHVPKTELDELRKIVKKDTRIKVDKYLQGTIG